MDNFKEIILKLHYLDLEINEIYQIVNKLRSYQDIDEHILKKVLLKNYKKYQNLSLRRIKQDLINHNIEYITILDENYPEKLENIYMPPLVLFYQGDFSLINKKALALIGSREYSAYGENVTVVFVRDLVKNDFVIISGLAYGIDSIAHRECIYNNGRTIAVLGSGLLNIYPKAHNKLASLIGKSHLLISEYSPYSEPLKTHFPFRNRIVSGLSDGVLVIEAKERSGTLITCDYALDQGRDIFVIPNDIFSKNSVGTNNLIKQGAYLVTSISDILEKINH